MSVVLPTRRGGSYLREAVASVLTQTYEDFELVVVADGCPEDLSGLETGDPRIRVIAQPNRGVSVARNVGVGTARGDLVAFLDDDDRMRPDRLEAQVRALDARPDAGVCHTQFHVIDAAGSVVDQGYSADVQYLDLLRREVRILLPTTMVRRPLLEEVGTFDSTLHSGEDLEVLYRLARDSALVFLPEVLTEYRRHGANTSGDALEAARDSLRLLQKHHRDARTGRRPDRATAAAAGLVQARRLGAAGSLERASGAWRDGAVAGAARAVGTALALAPGYAVHDLVGNRRPLTTIRAGARQLCHPRTRRPQP